MTETAAEPAGLRERKKLATRQALGSAAMQLAVERGLDNVLVEDIAAAAGVSPRTFNNYFASKYEAICALALDRAAPDRRGAAGRPAGESLWAAIAQRGARRLRGGQHSRRTAAASPASGWSPARRRCAGST